MKLNGNLTLNANGLSEIQNAVIERLASAPTALSAEAGRIYFNTTDKVYYYNNGHPTTPAWVALATGGNAASLQNEVDAIETAIGAAVDGTGTFVPGTFTGFTNVASPTSLTNVLAQLDSAISGKDQLGELLDVTLTAPTTGQFLTKSAGNWVNHTLVAADISDVTSTAAELNVLHGIPAGLTATELGYVDGVTSGIQGQLDGKQPLDATLTALAGLASTGIVVQTDVDTFAERSMVAPAAGFTITNPAGVAGNPTFALANDLAALEGLTTTGYVVRTGDGTATTRAMNVVSGDLVITGAADGVSTDTTFGLATITQGATGSFVKVTLDGKGRVTGNTPVVTADVTALVDGTYVNVGGDTMTGNLVFSNGATVTGVASPSVATDVATKGYVDSLTGGLTWQAPVANVQTVAAASLVSTGLVAGDRVLTTNDNKIYTWSGTAFNAGVSPVDGWALFDQTDETGYVFSGTSWVQFTGAGQITAGIGLAKTGNVLDINLGAGIAQLPSDEVGIDVAAGKAVQLTSTGTAGQLTFVLDGAGLEQSAAGLKISAAGVTNAMLANSTLTINGDAGTDALALGDTLQIKGTSVQGISTSVVESPVGTSTFTVTAADATSSQKGVATFNTASFAVASGDVTIKAAGVTNTQLVNSSITVSDGTVTDAVALGETLTVAGSGSISTAVTANTVTVSVADATTAVKGVASFSATDFSVASGAVSLVAKSIDTLTDVAVSGVTAGDVLVSNGTNFVNRKVYALYDGASATTHTVTHNLGQRYCNVTVIDAATNEVVIPQSIVFDSANQLTVTFNSALAAKVVVMGV